ncbi:MAG: glycosyltransferase family 39 protein [Methanospirillum sp.]|uniref:glycosyltransferase family 39 protein n=1 Tax=Methanospirillum sp. TaxID=45200 RepID=UPI00236E1674|nr:glycosyltransferase family 39 protein [Methanospirillum sp.]MDD1728850.1 glycosyltransferase family 39 protein [Methanospirillum sp.]
MPELIHSNPCRKINLFHPIFILIIFFIIISGVKILCSALITSPQIFADELAYDTLAKQIYSGALLTSHLPYPPGPFSPGYSFFVSFAYLLSPDKYAVYHYALIINAFLTTTIIFPAYYLLKPVTSRAVAVSGALLVTLLPAITMNTFFLMSEALFIPLTLFSVLFVQRSLSTNEPGVWDVLAGLSVFVLFFTRATGISMVIGLAIAVIWFLKSNRFQIENPTITKLTLLAGPGIMLYLVWIVDQLLMKGALPAGYSISYYSNLVSDALIHDPGHLIYVILEHLDYLLLGSFVIFPLLALMYWYSAIRSPGGGAIHENRNKTGIEEDQSPPISGIFYCTVTSLILFLFTIAHMCNLSYDYSICGRYLDAVIPLIIIGGIIGLNQQISTGNSLRFLKIATVYLIFTWIITNYSMLPFAHQPNNNAAIFYLYTLTAAYIVPYLSILLGIVLVILTAVIIRMQKGMTLLMILIIIIAAFCSLSISIWDIKTTKEYGSLLPFCQSVNQLDTNSKEILWDTASESDSWDRMVYYTLKFWLGDRVTELPEGSKPPKDGWLITKKTNEKPVIQYKDYLVVPMKGTTSPSSSVS